MIPGVTHLPRASITRASGGTAVDGIANRCDAPVRHDDDAIVDLLARAGEHGRVHDRGRLRGQRPIGARIGIVVGAGIERTRQRQLTLPCRCLVALVAGVAEHAVTDAGREQDRQRGTEDRLFMTDRP